MVMLNYFLFHFISKTEVFRFFLDQRFLGLGVHPAARLGGLPPCNAGKLNTPLHIRQNVCAPSDFMSGAMKTPSSDKMSMSSSSNEGGHF